MGSLEQDRLVQKVKSTVGRVKILTDYRPRWMRNPKTGKNLELDIFIPKFSLGIEYQGYLHHNGPMSDRTRERDVFKVGLAKKRRDVRIVEFFPQDLDREHFAHILLDRAEAVCRPSVFSALKSHIQCVSRPKKTPHPR